MAKDMQFGMRLPAEVLQVLRKAAADADRSASNLALGVLTDWLRKNGWLKVPRK